MELADKTEDYSHALGLMQYEIQRLWVIFGTFLLAETVLLGGLVSSFRDAPDTVVIGGAILGFLLVIPWWANFEYCRTFYLLRIDQAKRYESEDGFLKEGEQLSRGQPVNTRRISGFVRFMRPQRGGWFLMALFAFAFLAIALLAPGRNLTG